MSQKPDPSQRNISESSEYIDIFSLFRGAGRAIRYILKLILQNLLLVLLCIVIGLGVAYAYYSSKKPYYISEMVVTTGFLDPIISKMMLERLATDIEDGNPEYLAEKLKISPTVAGTVYSIGVIELPETDLEHRLDSSGVPMQPIVFSVTLSNPAKFDTLQNILVKYIENNTFYKQYKKNSEQNTLSYLDRINKDIQQLDSVKRTVIESGSSGTATPPEGLFTEGLKLYKKQEELRRNMELLQKVHVIVPFTPRSKPNGPKLWIFLLMGATIGFLAGLVFSYKKDAKKIGL